MKLPWNQKEKIQELVEENQELQNKLEEIREEKESFKNRFEAEKERRSEISAKKQEAEEKLNRLKQKIESKETNNSENEEEHQKQEEINKLTVSNTKKIISKLNSTKSTEEDLATVYCPKNTSKLSDTQGLKGSISAQNYNFISDDTFFAAFLDEDFIGLKLKMRPFFSSKWDLSNSFDVERIDSFIEEEKTWAAVSAGETVIFKERGGEILEREEVSSRVDSKQKKGGFSQGRFERKRQEQIDEHVRMVGEKIDEETLLVGEESLCKKLPGEYFGGFDHDRNTADALYNFRLVLK